MRALILLTVSLLALGQEETSTFKDALLGLSFNYPKAWRLEQRKHDFRFTFSLEGGVVGQFEVFRLGYVGSTEDWMATQRNIDISLKAETVRQWQEEILGVPLLLSQSKPNSPTAPRLVLHGLIYSRTDNKMQFRLSAPAGAFPEAEQGLRKVLESLRTLDGTLPKAEDPNRVPTPPAKGSKNTVVKPPPETSIGRQPKTEVVKAPQTLAARAANRALILRIPQGWTHEKKADDAYVLKFEGLSGEAHVAVASTLDSGSPGRALLKASAASLKLFSKVEFRQEVLPKANKAGALMAYSWRIGSNETGAFSSLEAVGQSEEFYWVLTWNGPPGAGKSQQEILFQLAAQMSVELAP